MRPRLHSSNSSNPCGRRYRMVELRQGYSENLQDWFIQIVNGEMTVILAEVVCGNDWEEGFAGRGGQCKQKHRGKKHHTV
jgi:hypothetical protein